MLDKKIESMRTLVEDDQLVVSNRKHLADIATSLFRKKGYHNTSTRDIAIASGMSVGALYQYIQHKEDLLILILQAFLEAYESKVSGIIQGDGSARERLERFVAAYYKTLDQHYAKTDVVYHEFANLRDETKDYFSKIENEVIDLVKGIVEDGIADGSLTDCNSLFVAHNIVSMGHMWALKRRRFRNIMNIDQYIEEQIRYLKKVLEPASETGSGRAKAASSAPARNGKARRRKTG